MFRRSDPQGSLFQTSELLPDDKRQRLKGTWAWQFRTQALPLIDEELFRELYCADNGRPNKPVQTVVGVLVLKEMFDLTDEETLGNVDFDTRWQVALNLTPEDAHCCQKTLHNFRAKLLGNDKAKLLFAQMTDGMLHALGLSAERQRLDSTHITSNIARLTRLGLFCETIRVFLRALKQALPEQFARVPGALRGRYLKEDDRETRYHDAKSGEAPRRLRVCARDVFRLVKRFQDLPEVRALPALGLLSRLLLEQCEISVEAPRSEADDADAGEPWVPVQLKESAAVSPASLQSPHDIDVTYSGHKGKGYEVQVAETVGNGEKPELLTQVEVTPACKSDEAATVPVVAALAARALQPKELVADTNYGSTENALVCAARGTELVTPVSGAAGAAAEEQARLAEFALSAAAGETAGSVAEPEVKGAAAAGGTPIEAAGGSPAAQAAATERRTLVRCPAKHEAESVEHDAESGRIVARFSRGHCAQCPLKRQCPAQRRPNGTRELRTSLREYTLARRRAYEQTEEFRKRYAWRAGIEATNSELKRAHGLGKLRVRGGARVKLAVYFKALACNVKRLVRYLAEQAKRAAQLAAAVQKATAHALLGRLALPAAPLRAVATRPVFRPLALAA